MTSITVSFVLVRLAAIFLFVRGVQGLSTYSIYLSDYSTLPSFGVATLVFGVALPISIAYLLWQYPEKITGAEVTEPHSSGPIRAEQLLLIGVSLLGMYLLVYGLLDLLRVESLETARLRIAAETGLPAAVSEPQLRVDRIIYGVQMLLGGAMVIGRRRMSELLLKAKYAAVQPHQQR